MRHRRKFFLALSIAGIVAVLPFPHSVILVAIGLSLIGFCHLPISLRARVTLIILAGAALAAVRAGWLTSPTVDKLQQVILPVLASMFMFRLAIYLYDLGHESVPATISERLSYFFLLPNVSFLLFPVVDYQTYRRSYYNSDVYAIYQKGLLWMVRGLVHLLLYRLVYQYLVPSPSEIDSLSMVVQFIVTSYLLYLRISGQFHLIAGIVCLFGYNLPETHHLYYLSSGFNDFWRRINIYWKDFMLKMVYYPAFVPLGKRFGMTAGIVIATVIVFLGTWLLHSYQWFWLRNSFPLRANDGLFWGFLGVMVVINSMMEARGKKKKQTELTVTAALAQSARTVGFFAFMSVLWSFWSSASPGEWLAIVSRAGNSGAMEFSKLAVALGAAIAGGVVLQFAFKNQSHESVIKRLLLAPSSSSHVITVTSVLILITLPYVRSLSGLEATFIMSLRQDQVNMRDQKLVDRGYYEGLLEQGNLPFCLLEACMRLDDFARNQRTATDQRNDLLGYELKASFTGTFSGRHFSTNRWRMRGKEYEQAKPPGTYRIALVGASYEMGSGVANDEVYESVLEGMLNREHPDSQYSRFEILNFSVYAYSTVHRVIVMETKLSPFDPDMVIVPVYSSEDDRLLNLITSAVENNIPIPYSDLQDIIERAGVRPWMGQDWNRERLWPYVGDILEWSFRKIKANSEKQGWRLVVLFLPTTTDEDDRHAEERLGRLWKSAVDAGLEPVRLENIYGNYKMSEIKVAPPWDTHPNAIGHQLIAKKLYEFLLQHGLGSSSRKP
jgi:hypothetical protein